MRFDLSTLDYFGLLLFLFNRPPDKFDFCSLLMLFKPILLVIIDITRQVGDVITYTGMGVGLEYLFL